MRERHAPPRRSSALPPIGCAILALLLGACGSQLRTGSGGASRNPTTATPALGDDEWATESWEDRHDTMTFAVLPNMARLFQGFHGSPYPDMTCRTCHGADAESVRYKMPHGLPPLDPAHLPSADSRDPAQARTAKFMIEQVTPQMADLLGVHVRDAAHPTGFSCFQCHPSL